MSQLGNFCDIEMTFGKRNVRSSYQALGCSLMGSKIHDIHCFLGSLR